MTARIPWLSRRWLVSKLPASRALLLGLLALAPALAACLPARAQVGLSATASSDYRFRGRSLSDNRPTAGVNLSVDHKSGAYAGASVIGVDTSAHGFRMLGYVDYLGYAGRLGSGGRGWDVGLTNANVRYYKYARNSVRYTEAFAGLSSEHSTVRLYYSPSYFGQGAKTLYLDLGGAFRPHPDLQVFAHLGALKPIAGRGPRRERYDMSAGAAFKVRNAELRFSVVHSAPTSLNPIVRKLQSDAVVLGAAYAF